MFQYLRALFLAHRVAIMLHIKFALFGAIWLIQLENGNKKGCVFFAGAIVNFFHSLDIFATNCIFGNIYFLGFLNIFWPWIYSTRYMQVYPYKEKCFGIF